MAALHWYDGYKGWDNDHPGWYTLEVATKIDLHLEIVEWIYEKIDNPQRHMRWRFDYTDPVSYFRFRHEKDYIWFRLTWS
jgi:hypothetical protein